MRSSAARVRSARTITRGGAKLLALAANPCCSFRATEIETRDDADLGDRRHARGRHVAGRVDLRLRPARAVLPLRSRVHQLRLSIFGGLPRDGERRRRLLRAEPALRRSTPDAPSRALTKSISRRDSTPRMSQPPLFSLKLCQG